MGRGSGSPLYRHRGVAAEVEAPLWKTNPRADRFLLPTPAFRACPHRGFPRCGIACGHPPMRRLFLLVAVGLDLLLLSDGGLLRRSARYR
jgi:hypothetical protein